MVIFECGIVIILQHKIEEHTEIRSVSKHSLTPCMCTFENVNCVECSGGSAIQFSSEQFELLALTYIGKELNFGFI